MKCSSLSRTIPIALLILSCLGVLVGYGGYVFFLPLIITHKIYERMQFVENGSTYEQWTNITQPIYFSVYLFNITNPEEFSEGAKPEMREVGPYVYLERRNKFVSSLTETTVKYTDHRNYEFMPQYSRGTPSDEIFALNIPLVATAATLRKLNISEDFFYSVIQPVLEGLLAKHEEELFVHKSISELLFDGYEIPFVGELTRIGKAFFPEMALPATNKFGLFLGKNGSSDNSFTVGTGSKDIALNKVLEWNGRADLGIWGGSSCNQINGTDGTQFPPFIPKDEPLFVFSTDLCRSIFLEYERESQVKGIPTQRFAIPPRLFANGEVDENNKCYCDAPDQCGSSGIISISRCRDGLPILLSSPHFFMGEPKLLAMAGGLKPNKAKHETFLDVLSSTGVVLRAAKRLQINIDVQQSNMFSPLTDITSRIVPIGWIEERMEATSSVVNMLKDDLLTPEKDGYQLCYSIGFLSSITAMLSTILYIVITILQSRSEKIGDFY